MSDDLCCGQKYVQSGAWGQYVKCDKRGKVTRDGKRYCGIHDPVAVAEKRAARSIRWDREYEIESLEFKVNRARDALTAAAEIEPTDVAAIEAAREALRDAERAVKDACMAQLPKPK